MNALVADPDIIRWIIWSWKPKPNTRWNEALTGLFEMMVNSPIDITITNTTITIFRGYELDVNASPPIVRGLFHDLTMRKHEYFETVENNAIFRNIKCSRSILNSHLDESIDRAGWVCWSIYWMIKFQPGRFFTMKDMLIVALRPIIAIECQESNSPLPKAPWIENQTRSIQTIYDRLSSAIYVECFAS